MPFRSLDPAQILQTTETLERRVRDRFPDRGLAQVAGEVTALARGIRDEVAILAPPIWWLRGLVALVVAAGAAVFLWVGSILPLRDVGQDAIGSVQGIEAAINTGLLAGLGLVALISLEARVKRRRVARGLHGLRSIIHVIDMHQLTKDPSAEVTVSAPTPSSPSRTLSPHDLGRYLDYCSEMLSLAAKVAVLYAQSFPDPVVTEAVNDLERTSASLSQKLWQKINILERRAPLVAEFAAPELVTAIDWAAAVPPGAGTPGPKPPAI